MLWKVNIVSQQLLAVYAVRTHKNVTLKSSYNSYNLTPNIVDIKQICIAYFSPTERKKLKRRTTKRCEYSSIRSSYWQCLLCKCYRFIDSFGLDRISYINYRRPTWTGILHVTEQAITGSWKKLVLQQLLLLFTIRRAYCVNCQLHISLTPFSLDSHDLQFN